MKMQLTDFGNQRFNITRIFIPKITVGEEKILYPALHLSNHQPISPVVGSTDSAEGAFRKTHTS